MEKRILFQKNKNSVKKIFKKISLAGLAACMFCLPILAGCAPAEMLPQNPEPGQNFDLGLNPATNPVVYTTASGLQIKKSDGSELMLAMCPATILDVNLDNRQIMVNIPVETEVENEN